MIGPLAVASGTGGLDYLDRLSGCQRVYILPDGFNPAPPVGGIKYPDFASVLQQLPTFQAMLGAEQTFEDYMFGHPGFPGGAPAIPGGYPIPFGYKDTNGTEWWLSEAEGLTESADWDQSVATPAVTDGAWLLGVRARARKITLKGVAVAPGRHEALRSVAEVSSALAHSPRTGWLYWIDNYDVERRIPVALSAQTKTKWKSEYHLDVLVECTGLNFGTAGRGTFLEGKPDWYNLPKTYDETLVVNGTVATPPRIEIRGPVVDTDFQLDIDDYTVRLTAPVPLGKTLIIDSVSHAVELDGEPARHMVKFSEERWPMLHTGAVHVVCNWTAGSYTPSTDPRPLVLMIVTPLW